MQIVPWYYMLTCLPDVLSSGLFNSTCISDLSRLMGTQKGACYLSLDWIWFWELLVLPSWCRSLCSPVHSLLLFQWLDWWFDNSISSVSAEHLSIFSLFFHPVEGCKSFCPIFRESAVPSLFWTRANWSKWPSKEDVGGTWDVTHRVIWCVWGFKLTIYIYFIVVVVFCLFFN